ncbi:hypothetical protein H4582DRAFT_887601 [Lactarius indigo]|nr:hypothetical protein H4582DRAFT_887601 [Lactarius indigo]
MDHPAMVVFLEEFVYHLFLTNDLCLYNIEQAALGHAYHNLTVVMNEKGLDLNGTQDWYTGFNKSKASQGPRAMREATFVDPDLSLR